MVVLGGVLGATIHLSFEKVGYDVVNEVGTVAVVGQLKSILISMTTPKMVNELRKTLYHVGATAAEKQLKRNEVRLRQSLARLLADSSSKRELINLLNDELAQIQLNRTLIPKLAEEIASQLLDINPDNASTAYRQAYKLFTKGDLDGSLKALKASTLRDSKMLIHRHEEALYDLKNAERKVIESKKQIQDAINERTLEANIYLSRFQWDSAQAVSEAMLSLDSENDQALLLAAYLAKKHLQIDKERYYYEKALSVTRIPYDSVVILMQAALTYSRRNEMQKCLSIYHQVETILSRTPVNNPNQDSFAWAKLYDNLSEIYGSLNMVDSQNVYLNLATKSFESSKGGRQTERLEVQLSLDNTLGYKLLSEDQISAAMRAFSNGIRSYRASTLRSISLKETYLKIMSGLGDCFVVNMNYKAADSVFNLCLKEWVGMESETRGFYTEEKCTIGLRLANAYEKLDKLYLADSTYKTTINHIKILYDKDSLAYGEFIASALFQYSSVLVKTNVVNDAEHECNVASIIFEEQLKSSSFFLSEYKHFVNKHAHDLIDAKDSALALKWLQGKMQNVVEFRDSSNLDSTIVSIRITIGGLLLGSGRLAEGYQELTELYREIANNEKYEREQADVQLDLGHYLILTKQYDKYSETARSAIARYQKIDTNKLCSIAFKLGNIFQSLAYFEFLQPDYRLALTYIKTAKSYLNRSEKEFNCQSNLKALNMLEKRIEINNQIDLLK